MKIYKFEIGFKGDLVTTEFEVRETPKTYKTNNIYFPTVINKNEIDVLKYGRMYSLTPKAAHYVKARIEAVENDIKRHEDMLASCRRTVERLRKLLAETESEEEKCNE